MDDAQDLGIIVRDEPGLGPHLTWSIVQFGGKPLRPKHKSEEGRAT